jgi:TonB-dependent receptor
MSKHVLLFFVCLFPVLAHAQTATIKGTVRDALTKEVIIGANVAVDGTTNGSSTDLEGTFAIKVAPGTYILKITYVSYKPQTVSDVVCEVGKVAQVEAFIEEDSKTLEEVGITAERQTNTIVALVNEIKFAPNVVVGISADQIQKTQDRDAGQVVRRIPGVSVADDRFIVVRGLGARYNTVMLNDVLTPSSEVDVKSFSFDMIPSGVIDRITISKSGAAENPGEFGGGVIKIYTKSDMEENRTNFSISTSYRAGTTFNSALRQTPGSTDFLGFDNNSRWLPSAFPSRSRFIASSGTERAGFANQLTNDWNPQSYTPTPDLRLGFNMTRKFNLGKMEVGNLTAINYSNTHQVQTVLQDRFIEGRSPGVNNLLDANFNDAFYGNNVRLGVLSNFIFRLNDRNRLEFRNLFNQMGSTETTLRNAQDFGSGIDLRNVGQRYEQRSIYSGQLAGKHDLGENAKLNWNTGLSFTSRREPDFRRFRTSRAQDRPSEAFSLVMPPSGGALFDNARFYSNLNEYVVMLSGNYDQNFKLGADKSLITKLKAGFYTEYKRREFDSRWFSYVATSSFLNPAILRQPYDQIFTPTNVTGTPAGLTLVEGTNAADRYEADNTLLAGYASLAVPISKKFNAILGLRTEFNQQRLSSRERTGRNVRVDNPIISPLPSLNLSYEFTEKMLVRAAYSWTINRPEFRELAPFLYYDFTNDFNFIGNPNLQIANIQNVEARWEFYPSPSELISFGGFYKYFQTPIEAVADITGGGTTRTYSYRNADNARNFGVEMEIRKSLYNSDNRFLQRLTFVANAALVNSQVFFSGDLALTQIDRPLAYQSPYLANAGIFYNNDEADFQVNILYNVIGPRIWLVGNRQQFPEIYEMPRNVVDVSFSKGLGKHWEIKGGVQDLLNAAFRFTEDSDRSGRIEAGSDQNFANFRRGQYVTLGINYKL